MKQSLKQKILNLVGVVDSEVDKIVDDESNVVDACSMEDENEVSTETKQHEETEISTEEDIKALLSTIIGRLDKLEAADKEVVAEDATDESVESETEQETEECETSEVVDEADETESEVEDRKSRKKTEDDEGEIAVGDSVRKLMSSVEILAPGFKPSFEMTDSKESNVKQVAKIQKQTLKKVLVNDSTSLDALLGDTTLNELDATAMNILFNAAVVMQKAKNNTASVINPLGLQDSKINIDPFAGHYARFYGNQQ